MSVATHAPYGLLKYLSGGPIRRIAVPLAAVLAVPLVAVTVPALTDTNGARAATSTTALPFDMPSTS